MKIFHKFSFLLVLLVLTVCPLAMQAQTNETEQAMDKIKLDEKYIYGESRDANKDIAYTNALADMVSTANNLREANGLELIGIGDVQARAKDMQYADGSENVAFVYMPVDEILAINATKPEAGNNEGTHIEYVSKKDEPAVAEAPAQEENLELDDVTRTICGQDNWTEIKSFLSQFKHDGRISQTGAVTDMSNVPADAYAVLIDAMYGIIAVLSPENGGQRTTLKSGSDSNNDNYKVIVWYK